MLYRAKLAGKTRGDDFSRARSGVDTGTVKCRTGQMNVEALQGRVEGGGRGLMCRRENRQGVDPTRNPAALRRAASPEHLLHGIGSFLGEFGIAQGRQRDGRGAKKDAQQ